MDMLIDSYHKSASMNKYSKTDHQEGWEGQAYRECTINFFIIRYS